eukprot:gene10027-2346_t
MGSLHQGHISLINNARNQCDVVISTIFINPIQFNNKNDFKTYPQNLQRDIELIQNSKSKYCQTTEIVLSPKTSEIYPNLDRMTRVTVDGMENTIEGKFRPGHFSGVATVVSKLFNISRPDYAYFGQKDALQCILIQRLINELNYPIELVIGDTLREPDGVAMSSRNSKLSKEQRKISSIIYQSLCACENAFKLNTEISKDEMISIGMDVLKNEQEIKFEYLTLTNFEGEEIEIVKNRAILSIAVFLGEIRLIDNVILKK